MKVTHWEDYTFSLLAFREALREARKQAGWTQQKIADHLGVSDRHYSMIETGKVDVRMSMFIELCNLFDLTPGMYIYLVGSDKEYPF